MMFVILNIILSTLVNPIQLENDTKEIVLIYIGSSDCNFCTSEVNKKYFRSILKKLEYKQGIVFKSVGISLDDTIENGFTFLSELNDFNEVIIADKNNNSAFLKYVINDYKGIEIIPQIVIMLRTIRKESDNAPRIIENEELLYRIVGLDKMKNFVSLVEDIDFRKFY